MTSLALNVISPSWLNNKWIVRKTASAGMRLQSCHAIMEALLPLQYNHQVVVVVVVVVVILFKCLLNLAIFFIITCKLILLDLPTLKPYNLYCNRQVGEHLSKKRSCEEGR